MRNVPERLHRELTRSARALDMTLTHYVQQILEREVARPSRDELSDASASDVPSSSTNRRRSSCAKSGRNGVALVVHCP